MVPLNESNATTGAISDLLRVIRTSSILTAPQLEKLQSKVDKGEYSPEPAELAAGLVKDGILTEFQARQVLKGRPQVLIFGRYLILDFLGKGTMGKVYKARHRMMGRVVALKILEAQYVSNSRSLARFQREMQLVGRLDHPNVVRAFDADRIGEYHFIAMEYVPGSTLQDLLKERGALPPPDVVYFASQAADGLAHAHAQGVLHRDIKPSNLLLTEDRKVKVLDFGLGTLVEQEEQATALTAVGITVGTPDYISPEQARMVKIDGRSDLYSLGCTMYHLISGKLPFKGESSMDCIVGRITGQGVPLTEVRPGLPLRLVQSIEKMMASNPDDRYQTADEAAAALRSLLRPKGVAPARSVPATAGAATVPEQAPAPVPVPTLAPASAPAPKKETTPQPPSLPVRAVVRKTKPKSNSLWSRWAGLGGRAKKVLAAVAIGAVSLIAVAAMLFGSSKSESPAARPSTASANTDPVPEHTTETNKVSVPPAEGAEVHQSSSLSIEIPKPGATVGMRENLTGRMESEGWPVIFVQADLPGQPWWCQTSVAKVDGGRFTTPIVFGDEFTPSGTRFRVAGIVARTREEALKFDIGAKEQVLPQGYPQSAVVVVTHR